MRNWFKKTFEKKPAGPQPAEEQERPDTISSLYEIVEDHLKSLDHDQIQDISSDFSERFAAHQEFISEIVKAPRPRGGRGNSAVRPTDNPDDFVTFDAQLSGVPGYPLHGPDAAHPDGVMLAHYDRMIRSQYDRLIDLTMDFLREITEAEIKRVDGETARISSEIQEQRDFLLGQIEQLAEDLQDNREFHRERIASLERLIGEQDRRADLSARRIRILAAAVIGAGAVGVTAVVLSLIG